MCPQTHSFGVQDRAVVEVAIDSDERDLIFGDVLVHVSPSHVTDKANAANLSPGDEGVPCLSLGVAKIRTNRTY